MANTCSPNISNTIKNLRFPLILGVVLIHNVLIEPQEAAAQGLDLVSFLIELMSRKMASPCVPLFFFISGYLFFVKFEKHFSSFDYKTQIRKRVRTLLVPYIIWNFLTLLCFALMHWLAPTLINPDFNNICHFTMYEFLRSFWDYPGGQPICFQLWFLRDLIEAVVFSPVFYFALKYGRQYVMLILTVLYLFSTNLFPQQTTITFFALGAGFAIHKFDFVCLANRMPKTIALMFCALAVYSSLNPNGGGYFNGLITLTGAATFVWVASISKNISTTLSESSFFIYAFHGLPILILSKATVKLLHPSTTPVWIGCYFACFVTIVLISLGLYVMLKRAFPRFTSIITGAR